MPFALILCTVKSYKDDQLSSKLDTHDELPNGEMAGPKTRHRLYHQSPILPGGTLSLERLYV